MCRCFLHLVLPSIDPTSACHLSRHAYSVDSHVLVYTQQCLHIRSLFATQGRVVVTTMPISSSMTTPRMLLSSTPQTHPSKQDSGIILWQEEYRLILEKSTSCSQEAGRQWSHQPQEHHQHPPVSTSSRQRVKIRVDSSKPPRPCRR